MFGKGVLLSAIGFERRSWLRKVAEENGVQSIAFLLIGAGSGGFNQEQAKQIMLDEMQALKSLIKVTIVEFDKHQRLQALGVFCLAIFSTFFAAINHLVPNLLPFLPPLEWSSTDYTRLFRQVGFVVRHND